jgi:hypothetical protein
MRPPPLALPSLRAPFDASDATLPSLPLIDKEFMKRSPDCPLQLQDPQTRQWLKKVVVPRTTVQVATNGKLLNICPKPVVVKKPFQSTSIKELPLPDR